MYRRILYENLIANTVHAGRAGVDGRSQINKRALAVWRSLERNSMESSAFRNEILSFTHPGRATRALRPL